MLSMFKEDLNLYMESLMRRPGRVDNAVRGIFDGWTLVRNKLEGNTVDHTPEFINKRFRSCQLRTEDIDERFSKIILLVQPKNIKVNPRWESEFEEFEEKRRQHVWLEVDFDVSFYNNKILERRRITWKYDAWKSYEPRPEKVKEEVLWTKKY